MSGQVEIVTDSNHVELARPIWLAPILVIAALIIAPLILGALLGTGLPFWPETILVSSLSLMLLSLVGLWKMKVWGVASGLTGFALLALLLFRAGVSINTLLIIPCVYLILYFWIRSSLRKLSTSNCTKETSHSVISKMMSEAKATVLGGCVIVLSIAAFCLVLIPLFFLESNESGVMQLSYVSSDDSYLAYIITFIRIFVCALGGYVCARASSQLNYRAPIILSVLFSSAVFLSGADSTPLLLLFLESGMFSLNVVFGAYLYRYLSDIGSRLPI